MGVAEVRTSTPRKLGGIPDLSQVRGDVRPSPAPAGDVYIPAPRPAAPAPEPELAPEQQIKIQKVGATIGTGIGAVFSYGFLRKASNLIAAGKPVGIGLGKIVPLMGAAIGAWGLVKKATVEWHLTGNTRKWDDLIRMAGDVGQIAGGIVALIPAIGLVPGLAIQLASIGVSWIGEMSNDTPTPATNPFKSFFGGGDGKPEAANG